jgi:hypothetical protein
MPFLPILNPPVTMTESVDHFLKCPATQVTWDAGLESFTKFLINHKRKPIRKFDVSLSKDSRRGVPIPHHPLPHTVSYSHAYNSNTNLDGKAPLRAGLPSGGPIFNTPITFANLKPLAR